MIAPSDSTVVEITDLVKSYSLTEAASITVLDHISLSLKRRELVVLSGVSGSGKSTLLNIIGGIERCDGGSVRVCGIDVGSVPRAKRALFRAHHIGFIFQFFNLLPSLTALENVTAALEPLDSKRTERRDRAMNALDSVGLSQLANKFPGQMSGGEQQRVSIARAMVKHPPLILADEPTGALDRDNATQVLECLKMLQKDVSTSIIVATHDPLVDEYADYGWHIADGKTEVTR